MVNGFIEPVVVIVVAVAICIEPSMVEIYKIKGGKAPTSEEGRVQCRGDVDETHGHCKI
jgi:hypothetical protein